MIPLLVLSSLVGWTMALAYYIRMKETERQNKAIVMELYQTLQDWSDQVRTCRIYANHIRSLESQIRLEADEGDWWKANTD